MGSDSFGNVTNRDWIHKRLQRAAEGHLSRKTSVFPAVGGYFEVDSEPRYSFSSNDYLDLAASGFELPANKRPAGICSSRLISGTTPQHLDFERMLAQFLSQEAALVYGSGYLANLGLASSLIRRQDVVFSDRLVHASMIDSITLSRAKSRRFRHNDISHLESLLRQESKARGSEQRFLILTESVFSMDGDLAPLEELVSLARSFDAELVVDEAHALGVFGPCGAGRVSALGLSEDVLAITGSLSKSFAAYGGFISGSELLRSLCVQESRSFIYNTALPPALVEDAQYSLQHMLEHPELGETLLSRAEKFRERLTSAGYSICGSESHIVPLRVKNAKYALSLSARLAEDGIYCHAIRPPTVPEGQERLRFSLTLAHSSETLDWVIERILHHLEDSP